MSWVAVAVGGGAALSAGGGIFSSIFGGNAQIKASKYAADSAERTALKLDDRARADLKPFRQMGVQAGETLMAMLSGEADPNALTTESTLYKYQRDLGMRDLTRQLSARGLQSSGAGMETLAKFTNQLAAEEGQRFYDRLFNMTTLGSNAAARTATNTSQTGNNLAGIQGQLGLATANAVGAQYQGVGNVIQGAGNTIAQYPMYRASMNMLNNMGQPSPGIAGMSPVGPYATGYKFPSLSLTGS